MSSVIRVMESLFVGSQDPWDYAAAIILLKNFCSCLVISISTNLQAYMSIFSCIFFLTLLILLVFGPGSGIWPGSGISLLRVVFDFLEWDLT